MSESRKLPAVEERVETGPVQFGNDWPGVFIRGDNAFHYAMQIEMALVDAKDIDPIERATLEGLIELFRSCHV